MNSNKNSEMVAAAKKIEMIVRDAASLMPMLEKHVNLGHLSQIQIESLGLDNVFYSLSEDMTSGFRRHCGYSGHKTFYISDSPLVYIDNVRSECRWLIRDDDIGSKLIRGLGFIKTRYKNSIHDIDLTADIEAIKNAPDVFNKIRARLLIAFDEAYLALKPTKLSNKQRDFITWIKDKNGAFNSEICEWMRKRINSGHIDTQTVFAFTKKFCVKNGPRKSLAKWVLHHHYNDLV